MVRGGSFPACALTWLIPLLSQQHFSERHCSHSRGRAVPHHVRGACSGTAREQGWSHAAEHTHNTWELWSGFQLNKPCKELNVELKCIKNEVACGIQWYLRNDRVVEGKGLCVATY